MKQVGNKWFMMIVMAGLFPLAGPAQPASSDWGEARWIELPGDPRPESPLLKRTCKVQDNPAVELKTFPSPLMRCEFTVTKNVQRATVQVCGLGYFELYLNGMKVGDHVLDPVQTTYDKRACYVTFDVTGQLQSGGNAVGLMLGNGFFGQNFAFVRGLKWGQPAAIALLEIEYADGSRSSIATGPEWKATTGPILFDNVYVGETYDARLELPGWTAAGFDDSEWMPVAVVESPTKQLIKQPQPPMKKIRSITPVKVMPSEDGGWILDMGRNMTGRLHIRVQEKRGSEIIMRFAEHLMPDGQSIDTGSTGVHVIGNDQTEIYVCKGDGVEEWEPRFTYHGFRYVQITGLSSKPKPGDFTGWLIRTDLDRVGAFECSDPLLNHFYEVSLWTIECNVQGILTDCPHREKCAWLGDMHAAAETISMNYDARSLWSKHTDDFKMILGAAAPVPRHYPADDRPAKDPRAPANIACGKRLCGQARPDWGMALVLVPWFNWLYYGDQETAENAWPMMSDYMDFLFENEVADYLIKEGYAYGDWCPPGGNTLMDTSPQLSASALYYHSASSMRQMAGLLGKSGEESKYKQLASSIKAAFNEKFYRADTGDYGSQTGTAMALHLGLVPADRHDTVAKALAERIMKMNQGHYTTGILGHRGLYTVLNDAGLDHVTHAILHRTEWPSLAYMTETKGLTTWPEANMQWSDGERVPKGSYSHPMQSGFAVTFHESIGGIRPDPDHPGFRRAILMPCFMEGLEWAKAEHRSPHGLISSHWNRRGDQVVWTVELPQGTSAEIWLPALVELEHPAVRFLRIDGRWRIYEVDAGTHEFSL